MCTKIGLIDCPKPSIRLIMAHFGEAGCCAPLCENTSPENPYSNCPMFFEWAMLHEEVGKVQKRFLWLNGNAAVKFYFWMGFAF